MENTKQDLQVLIGYVNSFEFNDPTSAELMNGHPKPGRVYQIIKDTFFGYRLHIGSKHTKDNQMEGILLGSTLVGSHDLKWVFDISILTEDNLLEYNLDLEDVAKVTEWFATDNKELMDILKQPVRVVAKDDEGNLREFTKESAIENDVEASRPMDESDSTLFKLSNDMNTLVEKDLELIESIGGLISYLTTTYSDKYEATGKVNMGKEFLLNSKSPDTCIFNSLKYLQRYCTVGFEKSQNPKDLYKAVHYILFELQRRQRNEA